MVISGGPELRSGIRSYCAVTWGRRSGCVVCQPPQATNIDGLRHIATLSGGLPSNQNNAHVHHVGIRRSGNDQIAQALEVMIRVVIVEILARRGQSLEHVAVGDRSGSVSGAVGAVRAG